MMIGLKKIAVFAGTTEGRKIAEHLEGFPVQMFISTATEYGKEAAGTYQNAAVYSGRMGREEMEEFLTQKEVELVIDATHPFAEAVTANLREACKSCGISYIRCLREESEAFLEETAASEAGPAPVLVDSIEQAVDYLQGTEGNILIATGSKDLKAYTALKDYRDRCYARVLSSAEAVSESSALGFTGAHLIAMQGPFSREMNKALLSYTNAAYFVTKESGKAGGFPEKLEAAREAGAVPVVIRRPREEGMALSQLLAWLDGKMAIASDHVL